MKIYCGGILDCRRTKNYKEKEMNDIMFGNLGYGNPNKESLWNHCKQEERLNVLLELHKARSLIERFRDTNTSEIKIWSELSYENIPKDIQPLLFFAFNGHNFSADNVQKQINRFYD